MSRTAPFDLTCEFSDVSSEKLCYNACFCEAHRRDNRIKNGGSGSGRIRDTIKSCVKLGYKPTEMLGCYKEMRDAEEMKNNTFLVEYVV